MITTVKQGLRRKLLDAGIAKQLFLINDFKDRIKTLTQTEGLGNEESYDNEDLANNSARVAEINTLNDQLEFANKELDLLESLKTTQELDRHRVAPGAIVVTDHHTFFISTSLEKFVADGHVYIGISTAIYNAMAGKSKGENLFHSGVNYAIKDII